MNNGSNLRSVRWARLDFLRQSAPPRVIFNSVTLH